ncbi:MAG TPA: hypothetical protein VHR66_23820 [Gemmataceae bacterium]|nr:hypothetical protein [Gemmataceae bacterium]
MTNPLESLCSWVTLQNAETICELDLAETTTGSSFLTVKLGDYRVIVDWRPDRGFGITAGRDGAYGEGPDERIPDLAPAERRVLWLLQNRGITSPPSTVARTGAQQASTNGSPWQPLEKVGPSA